MPMNIKITESSVHDRPYIINRLLGQVSELNTEAHSNILILETRDFV